MQAFQRCRLLSLRLVLFSFFFLSLFFYFLVYTFSCHQKTIKCAIAYMSRTQIEFITPKCSRLFDGMFQELFEQIINIFFRKELPHSPARFFFSYCLSSSSYHFTDFLSFPTKIQRLSLSHYYFRKALNAFGILKSIQRARQKKGKGEREREIEQTVQKCQSKFNN